MIVEERNYGLRPGGVKEYLRIWHECGRQPQTRHLGDPIGVYQTETGTLNTLVYLWGFSSWEDRDRRRAALMADPEFAAFRSQVRALVHSQQNRILTPASVMEGD
ncbi:NIPSNAP family protein [Nonomuraea basaltis]|uniref:NIPSNAP family protein n=1 Tax=Nonomuraea basaltis TaxID=2495887 RepID=UPI00110C589F|nr:NIPSNAP family protein [Nonomuraea basaltis]TMR97807.1 NIPSNAP family protein [Nonomuraea basaltis]